MSKLTKHQKKAVEFDEKKNVLISAGAGSGKTSVITKRVVEKLKKGVSINDLLILTFTNAAALEMKQRIYLAIKEYKDLQDQLDLIDVADIMTFDAYYLKLFKQYSYFLDINKNIAIENRILLSNIFKQGITEVLDEEYNNKNELFFHLLQNYTIFDDDTLKDNLLNLYFKYESILDINDIENDVNKLFEEYTSDLRYKYKQLKNNLLDLQQIPTDEKGEDYINKVIDYFTPATSFMQYDSLLQSLEMMKSAPRIPSKDFENKDLIKENVKRLKDNFSKIKEKTILKEKKYLIEEEKEVLELKSYILSLLKRIDEKILQLKIDNLLFTYGDISKLTFKILAENNDLKNNLKNKYNEIIVDEYQDTNDFQNEFINLIANNNLFLVGDVKQSIYGFRNANPKNFQKLINDYEINDEGEVINLLDNFRSREEVLSSLNDFFRRLMTENLGSIEYKDNHELNFGNKMFDLKNEQDYFLETIDYSKKETENFKEEAKDLSFTQKKNYKSTLIEPFLIAKDIKSKIDNKYKILDLSSGELRNARYTDFSILTIKKSSYKLYQQIFNYYNIPIHIQQEKEFNDFENHELFVVKNILKLVLSNKENNKLEEISILRSYLYRVEPNIIYKYIKFGIDNIGELKDLREKISELKLERNGTIEYLLDKILVQFQIVKKASGLYNQDEFLERINKLYEISDEFDNQGKTLFNLYNYLCEVIEYEGRIEITGESKKKDAVELMTIHKSKGLEFPVVYIAGLGDPKGNKNTDLIDLNSDFGLVLPRVNNYIREDTFLYTLSKEKRRRDELDESIRLLYVAMTRAKEKIILLNDLDQAKEIFLDSHCLLINNLTKLVNNVLSEVEFNRNYETFDIKEYKDYSEFNSKQKKIIDASNKKIDIEYKSLNLKPKKLFYGNISSKLDKILSNNENASRELGTKMHKYLEFYNILGLKDLLDKPGDVQKTMITQEINEYYNSNNEEKKILINALANIVQLDVLKGLIRYYTEYEFNIIENKKELNGVIDLVLENEDNMIVIDYKLKNLNKEDYQNQVKTYIRYLQTKTDKKVSGFLYSLIDGKLSKKIEVE